MMGFTVGIILGVVTGIVVMGLLQVNHCNEEANHWKKEAGYWKCEALKWADKLGEIRIFAVDSLCDK